MTPKTIYPSEVQAVQKAIRDLVRETIEKHLQSDAGDAKIREILGSFVEKNGIEVVSCPYCQEDNKEGEEEPFHLRETVQDLIRKTVENYLNSEEGKGLLVRLLDELENDEGPWITVTSEEGGAGNG